ncbi:MAG: glycosyltransferase family 2 protein [Clostridia bacterium]|nr:glycosyltransferase family 2 protein [Clostridia bacterium]
MVSISLCMIVKNEDDVIERCLSSVSDLVDEIIIVDTGSTDKTIEIVKKFTDKIYEFPWINDFSAARNFSFSKATKDYIFWIDADEVMYEEDREKFRTLKETLDYSVDSVTMRNNEAFDEEGNVTFSFRRNRLVKRENNYKWKGACHNLLVVSGNIINSDIGIAHKKLKKRTDRTLKMFQNRLENGENFNVRDLYYYANELYDHKLYEEALVFYNKVINRSDGWYENKIYACGRVSDYYASIGELHNAFKYAFKSFEYALPRAEFCCRIGKLFIGQNKISEAIFWYEMATNLEKPKESWGFFIEPYWTWIPNIQLCICYDKLGDHEKAFQYNEIARSYVPKNKSVLHNVEYFKKLGYE